MRCFSTILITAVSVCAALESRRYCDSCSLLKISTRGFYSFSFFPRLHLPNLAQWLMAEGQLWSDEIEYIQHRLLERPVKSWAHRITTWLLCVSRPLKDVFVFAQGSSLNLNFYSIIIQRVIWKKKNLKVSWVETSVKYKTFLAISRSGKT